MFKREEDEQQSFVQRSTSGIISRLENEIGKSVASSSPRTEGGATKNFESLLRQPSLTNPFNNTNYISNAEREPHRVHWMDTQPRIEKSISQGNIRRKESFTNLLDSSVSDVRIKIVHMYKCSQIKPL